LDSNLNIVMEFKNTTKCADYFGYTRGNVKNARIVRKYWVVRQNKLEESIELINIKIKNNLKIT